MKVAQIILIAWFALGLLVGANAHGKPHKEPYSFWNTLIGDIIVVGLLLWGGFFA